MILPLKQICFEDRFINWKSKCPSFSHDGTDLWVFERTEFTKRDFSHKFKHAGLRYEVSVALGTSKIIHIAGGVPAGAWNDLKLAQHLLVPKMKDDEKASADKGYRGDKHFITPIESPDPSIEEKIINKKLKLIQSRHEMVNARFKTFKILTCKFRWSRNRHRLIMMCIGNIVQLKLEESPLPSLKEMFDTII